MTKEEAIKIVKEFINGTCFHLVDKEALETLIPELNESEDERIRKRLIEYFEGFRMGNAEVKWEGLTVQEVLAWLEKRKEQKPLPPFDEMSPEEKMNHPLYLEGFDTGRDVQKVFDEQKPAEWSAKGRRGRIGSTPEHIRKKAENFLSKMEPPYDADDICSAYETGAMENANSSWSEEDEKMLRTIISDGSRGVELDSKQISWLKSLRLQPKEEWSKEDEEIFNNIIEKAKGGHWIQMDEIAWLIARFKSLRPVSKESLQPHWKPSEEQMESLAYAIQVLNSNPHPKSAKAYQDLQTLYKNIKYGN